MREQPAGNIVTLAQTGPVGTGNWHSVSVATQTSHIQVYIDYALWINYRDNAPVNRGTIGVASLENSQVMVDNVLVLQLSSPLPTAVVQAPPAAANVQAPVIEPAQDGSGGLSITQVEPEPEVEQGLLAEEPTVEEPSGEEPTEEEPTTPGLPELHLSNFSMTPSSPDQGQEMTVAVIVYNGGEADAGAFNVCWYPKGAHFGGCSWDIYGLPAGEAVDMVCTYQGYPRAGTFNWGISVDVDHEISESDEGNNEQSGYIVVNPVVAEEPPREPITCVVSSMGPTSVVITWASFNDASWEGFRIYQGITSLETTIGPDEVMVTIGNLAPATQYHFDVRAFNEAGESQVDACFVYVTTNP